MCGENKAALTLGRRGVTSEQIFVTLASWEVERWAQGAYPEHGGARLLDRSYQSGKCVVIQKPGI